MKKKLKVTAAVFLILVLITVSVSPMVAFEIKRYYGDITNDGVVSTVDARIILKIAVGVESTEYTDNDLFAADVDGDGKITTKDARLALKMATGIISLVSMTGVEFDTSAKDFTSAVNAYRQTTNSELVNLKLSSALSKAADAAAKEFITKTGTALTGADNSYYNKLLDSYGIKYEMADKIIITSKLNYKQALIDIQNETQSRKAILSTNFDTIGIGAYSSDGRTVYWCVFLIKTTS